jgi:hypothetical protein
MTGSADEKIPLTPEDLCCASALGLSITDATALAPREIRRRRLLAIFEQAEPIWKDEDHPELAAGADEWVRQLRRGR